MQEVFHGEQRSAKTEGSIVSEYEFIVDQVRQAVWRLDSSGKVIEANRFACRWLELEPEALIGCNIVDLTVHRVDMLRDETFEVEFKTASGHSRRAIVASRLLRHDDGMLLGAVQVVTDVTSSRAIDSRLVVEIQKMAKMAGEDALTGLANRRAFDMVYDEAVQSCTNEPFAVLLADLNDLKPINDSMGHEAGDTVLKDFAQRLKLLARASDFVCRIGGDEFAVVLTNCDSESAKRAGERYQRTLDYELEIGGRTMRVRAAVGVAHSSQGADSVLSRADLAMYERKRGQKASQVRNL